MDLVALKVKIGLRSNGHADHPDWYKLPLASSENPNNYIKHGWFYDKTSGHREKTPESPIGMQWGVILVTPKFAAEALKTFPDTITSLSENELKHFWEQNVFVYVSEFKRNTEALTGLKREYELRELIGENTDDIKRQIGQALNPSDNEPGIQHHPKKKWARAKEKLGINIVSP